MIRLTLVIWILAIPAEYAIGDRVLHFPKSSVGQLSVLPAVQGEFGYSLPNPTDERWSKSSPAVGEVIVPDGHVARLTLDSEAGSDLTWIENFQPDAIDALNANALPVSEAGLANILHLTGLKHLQVTGPAVTSTTAQQIADRLPRLQYLGLRQSGVSNDAMPSLAEMPNLETVDLYGTKAGDIGLAKLATSQSVKAVFAGMTQITDEGVASLCSLENLRALSADADNPAYRDGKSSPQISDDAINSLAKCHKLEYLDLSGSRLSDAGLARLASALPSLRVLGVEYSKVTENGLAALRKLPRLQGLAILGIPATDKVALHISALPALRELRAEPQSSDKGVERLSGLRQLRHLSLMGPSITNDCMKYIARMESLRSLVIQDTAVTDVGVEQITGMPTIAQVTLSGDGMTTQCISTLATLPKLESLSLSRIASASAGSRDWDDLDRLKFLPGTLSIRQCPLLSLDDMRVLGSFSSLKHLVIEESNGTQGRPLTNADMDSISSMTNLEMLTLTSTLVSDEGLVAIRRLPELRQLSISCLATEAGLSDVCGAVSMRSVAIGSPYLTAGSAAHLRRGHKRLPEIRIDSFRLEGSEVAKSPADHFWRKGRPENRTELDRMEGKIAPPIHATHFINCSRDLNLEDYRGKVVVVEFWGTWCGACVAQFPEIERLEKKYAERGVAIISVHSTEAAQTARKFVEGKQVKWPVAVDEENRSRDAYHVSMWPACYLLDRHGIVRAADIYPPEREAAIETLLGE